MRHGPRTTAGGVAAGAVAVVTVFVVTGAVPALFHATAPPAGVTGGFGEVTCAFCHIGSDLNAYGGSVGIEGLPAAYEAGGEYVLTIDLRAEETAVAGFQLAARFVDGDARGRPAGVLEPIDGRTATSDSAGVVYLHQTEAGAVTHDPSGARWSFGWRAPDVGGRVMIHVAANSGNGDNSPLGDLVYTTERTLPMASAAPKPHPLAPYKRP